MVSPSQIDKALRRVVSPVLLDSGFTSVTARKAWAWRKDCIWNLTIRSVGGEFSQTTGWPSGSVGVWMAVYYLFIPFRGHTPPKTDKHGRLVPDEGLGHFRSHLESSLDQQHYMKLLDHPTGNPRRDLWWVGASEDEVLSVVSDIAWAVVEQGRPWFARLSDLHEAFRQLESERDSLHKFYRAKYFAEHLSLDSKAEEYSEKMAAEARRIGFPEDGRWPAEDRKAPKPRSG